MTDFLGALAQSQDFHYGFPASASAEGSRIDSRFWIMTLLTVPFLIAVVGFMAYCLVRFRAKEGRPAQPIRGFKTATGTVVLVVALLLMEVPMDLYQESVWASATIDFPKPEDSLVVQVYAEQFAWNFRYAGKDGKFGTPDDLTTINQLRVPAGKPVICVMKSRDVVHSFWLPHFRVKLDVMPGLVHRVWFKGSKPGVYEIACAELCGLAHYRMRGILTVLEPAAYDKWRAGAMKDLEDDGPGDEAAKWKLWDKQ